MKHKIVILSTALLLSLSLLAQKNPNPNPALIADSLATGNYKDVLNSFFQIALEKFTGPDKELKFTSTPFAVMARIDTTLLTDTNYVKYNTLRSINFSFSAKLDSTYKFNGFSSGIKYAIINKRDETVSKAFLALVADNEIVKELYSLNNLLDAFIAGAPTADKASLIIEKTAFTDGKKNFNQLSPVLQAKIKELASQSASTKGIDSAINADNQYNINTAAQEVYKKLKKGFNNNLLWTAGIADTTYKDQFIFSNIVLSTELLKGISNSRAKNEVELNIRSSLQFIDDTLLTGRDLKRTVFSFEPGFNIVLKTKTTNKSFFEMKFSGGYYHVFNGLYKEEEKDRVTLNNTLRIRIIDDIWIPLEIRYDTKKGNFQGFLNVRANFKALGNIAKYLKF